MIDKTYYELSEQLTRAQSVDEIHDLCSRICETFGFDHFVYGARVPTSLVKPRLYVVSGYSGQWWEHYKQMGYMAHDPTIRYCHDNVRPCTWDRLPLGNGIDQQIMDEAGEHGIRSGLSIPIHGARGEAAMFNLASSRSPADMAIHLVEVLPYVHLLASFVHEASRRVLWAEHGNFEKNPLTEREKECLLWSAEGKTSWETSQILGISERTVTFHLQNAAEKLKVCNRQQAIARVISHNLIAPPLA